MAGSRRALLDMHACPSGSGGEKKLSWTVLEELDTHAHITTQHGQCTVDEHTHSHRERERKRRSTTRSLDQRAPRIRRDRKQHTCARSRRRQGQDRSGPRSVCSVVDGCVVGVLTTVPPYLGTERHGRAGREDHRLAFLSIKECAQSGRDHH